MSADRPMTPLDPAAGLVEALETLRRMASKPYKSWDSGSVIDAQRVDEVAEEALEAYRARPPSLDPATIEACAQAVEPWVNKGDNDVDDALQACAARIRSLTAGLPSSAPTCAMCGGEGPCPACAPQGMRPAREVAHEACPSCFWTLRNDVDVNHSDQCNRVTAAIEADRASRVDGRAR